MVWFEKMNIIALYTPKIPNNSRYATKGNEAKALSLKPNINPVYSFATQSEWLKNPILNQKSVVSHIIWRTWENNAISVEIRRLLKWLLNSLNSIRSTPTRFIKRAKVIIPIFNLIGHFHLFSSFTEVINISNKTEILCYWN